jgi:hypothetical protein
MYVYRRQVAVEKGIATLLALALVLWVTGTHMFMQAEAANLTYIKDTLSNSAPSETSNHTIQFLSPTGVGSNATITVTFPNAFNISTSSVTVADVDFEINGVDETLVAGTSPAAGEWGFTISGQDVRLVSGSAESLGINATATIKIGTNADGPGVNMVTNPSNLTSYEFTVSAGTADSGQFRIAIVDDVLVTANVDTTLTFTVSGVADGATVNTSPTTTSTTTTSDTLPFETLVPNVSKTLAQDLAVATNARNGFVVTVEQSQQLLSSTGADIDGFVDGSWTTTPTAWAAPANNIASENTWGHWGLTSEDFVTGRSSEFSGDTWVAASTTPIIIMGHTGPSDGATAGQGATRVGYQAQITALQEAGDDYNTTLTYIATPTF